MKISASIYSDRSRPLKEVIEDLVNHQVDLLHVDCNDDLTVFEDIKNIREWCNTPIDLHIITEEPQKFYPFLEENPVEYVTFQFENLKEKLSIPDTIKGKKGLAVITPTDVHVFNDYKDFDFILIMATIPGQSGGKFDKYNFSKIRDFRKSFPGKSIHVDGGVNGEVSFILRNMGVNTSVSGSYLFKGPSIGNALMNLTKREMESDYKIKDFMVPMDECPVINSSAIQLGAVLQSIEDGNLGFTLLTDEKGVFKGLISNADIRKGMLKNLDDLNKIDVQSLVNESPITLNEEMSVVDILQTIKELGTPVMYFPIIDGQNKAKGIVTFLNLIKSEL